MVPSSRAKRPANPAAHGGDIFEMARVGGVDPQKILDFSSNTNPLGPPPSVLRAIRDAERTMRHYPDPTYRRLREAAATYAGVPDMRNVVEGNGSTELIYLFAQLFVGEGTSVVMTTPSFSEYERAVRLQGGLPVFIARGADLSLDVRRVIAKIENGCSAVFLASPDNPSSRTIREDELVALLEKASRLHIPVLLDEAFVEFSSGGGPELSSRVEEFPNLFVARSLTKIFSLPGLRVGYGLASAELAERLRSAKMPWSVNSLAQEAAIAAFREEQFVRRTAKMIAKEREWLFKHLTGISRLRPFRPEANFVLSRVEGTTAPELKGELFKSKILVRDCSSFRGLDGSYFRVSVRRSWENSKLISALGELLVG